MNSMKSVCKIFIIFLINFKIFSNDIPNLFNNKLQKGFELKNPSVRIGYFNSKRGNPLYLPDLDKIESIIKKDFSTEEWKSVQIPFEYKDWKGEKQIFSVSILYEFTLKELNQVLDLKKEISLHIPFYNMCLEVFLNQKKISKFESCIDFEKKEYIKVNYARNTLFLIPSDMLKDKNELVIVLSSILPDPIRFDQVMNDYPIEINNYSEHVKIFNEIISFMLLFLYFFVGAYHLLLFSKRPKEIYNLWFGGFSIFLSFYYITRTNYIYTLNWDNYFITKMEYTTIFYTSLWALLFYENFHLNRSTIFSKLMSILISFYGLSIWFSGYFFATKILFYWQLTAMLILFYSMGLVIYYAFIKKNKDSLRLVLGMLVLAFTVILDILGATEYGPKLGIYNYGLARYGFFAFIIGIAFVLANKFLRVYKEVEDLNLHLEEKVKERTKELNESLEQIKKLKEQQDGDYFLTSLLLQPLIYNQIDSEVVKVEHFLKQKKEFRFKKWQKDIGGDIIMSQNISLKNKPFIFIFNGDAMGKSLQGAGGSLVAGVVIKAILTRTLLYYENQDKFPEKWLKELFVELHKVFESFDGSMLCSGFLGLIEENTGTLYYIYAEHPYPILYRNQKAEFLDNTTEFKKFGTPGIMNKISINVFPLEPNDYIFIGSDGKDDLVLKNENNQDYINEDETLILRIIEKSEGNLQAIFSNLQQTGSLMDDISIIKICYKEGENHYKFFENTNINRKEIEKQIKIYKQNKDWISLKSYLEEIVQKTFVQNWLYRELIIAYYQLKDYAKAIEHGSMYLENFPHDNKILYLVARSFSYQKNYRKAFELSERLDLRDPKNIPNLINLVYCLYKLKEVKKSIKALNRLMDIALYREDVKKLKEMILGN